MKAQLVFNLDDRDDAIAHFRCVKALDMALCLYNIKEALATISDTSEDGRHIDYLDLMNAVNEAMEKQSINIDDLII